MARHRMRGEVTSVSKHGEKHVRVSVVHGKKAPKKKGKANSTAPSFGYDDRPESTVVVPNSHAKHYPVGKKVSVGLDSAAATLDDDTGEDLDGMSRRLKGKR